MTPNKNTGEPPENGEMEVRVWFQSADGPVLSKHVHKVKNLRWTIVRGRPFNITHWLPATALK